MGKVRLREISGRLEMPQLVQGWNVKDQQSLVRQGGKRAPGRGHRESEGRKREKQGMLGMKWTGPYILMGHCPNSPISSLKTCGKWKLNDHDPAGPGTLKRRLMAEPCVGGQGWVTSLLLMPGEHRCL